MLCSHCFALLIPVDTQEYQLSILARSRVSALAPDPFYKAKFATECKTVALTMQRLFRCDPRHGKYMAACLVSVPLSFLLLCNKPLELSSIGHQNPLPE